MSKRKSKTFEQQCRFYEVENIFDYVIELYVLGHFTQFRKIYKEFDKGTRADCIQHILQNCEHDKACAMVLMLQSC